MSWSDLANFTLTPVADYKPEPEQPNVALMAALLSDWSIHVDLYFGNFEWLEVNERGIWICCGFDSIYVDDGELAAESLQELVSLHLKPEVTPDEYIFQLKCNLFKVFQYVTTGDGEYHIQTLTPPTSN